MGRHIPRDSLHRALHAKIHDIPCPEGRDCRRAFEELLRLEALGCINVENDTCEQRLDFLISMWRESCPATTAILEWQRDVIHKFYERDDGQ